MIDRVTTFEMMDLAERMDIPRTTAVALLDQAGLALRWCRPQDTWVVSTARVRAVLNLQPGCSAATAGRVTVWRL